LTAFTKALASLDHSSALTAQAVYLGILCLKIFLKMTPETATPIVFIGLVPLNFRTSYYSIASISPDL
jgi:hypothetical protein